MARIKKQNSDYWKKRMAALENSQFQNSAAYYRDVQEQFRRAANSIQMDIERWYQRLADNNDISYAAAKRLLKKNELDEFKWSVEQYIKVGKENAVDQRWIKELENASARHHISYLEAMKVQVQQHAELLSTEFEGGMTDFLHKSYADGYYRTAFEVSKVAGVGVNLEKLDDKSIDTVLKKPWARDGDNFSDRIWKNKERLVNNLHTELTQSIIRGESPQKAIDRLAKTMNVSRTQAGRLIMTESAAVSSTATKDSFRSLGVEQYEILATLDSRTSEICQELDGKVFDMKDYAVGETAPPFHPNCRTTTVPHFDDEFSALEKRSARDEESGDSVYVNGKMKYSEWKREYISGSVTDESREVKTPEKLKITGTASEDVRKIFDKETAMIPSEHMKLIESTVKKVVVDPVGNSRYDRNKGILYLAAELEEGEAIHELSHVLETRLNIYQNEEYTAVLKSGLEDFSWSDLTYVPDEYGKPICILKNPKLISEYQGRMYEEAGFWDESDEFNPYALAEYFSEGYREFILRPDRLKRHDEKLYDFIKGISE